MDARIQKILEPVFGERLIYDCPLKKYTTLGIGGPADALVVVEDEDELRLVLGVARAQQIPWRVIGKGSNILVRDAGYRGLVLKLGGMFSAIEVISDRSGRVSLQVGAGCSLTRLNRFCWQNSLSGLEFSYGIPGTLGGAVLMNAGAWGREMAEVVREVALFSALEKRVLEKEDLRFCYRGWPDYGLYAKDWLVADIVLALKKDDGQKVEARSRELLQKRKLSQPYTQPSAGSFFKNPRGHSAGQLIDECGLKGLSVGGAMVSTRHANFLVNTGSATARDMLALMAEIQKAVREKFAIDLEPEVHIL
ncbi:MAG: UDP-N-acetylenolpyruvoylglucosamine reductase [Deltaproteobacteria bacterium]|nr:MAG: UDP-N-acetylenolpyruvoylglucosamine reductase [Deltaproteobacteria bacterium]